MNTFNLRTPICPCCGVNTQQDYCLIDCEVGQTMFEAQDARAEAYYLGLTPAQVQAAHDRYMGVVASWSDDVEFDFTDLRAATGSTPF